jgi:predicted YcjX-like family ATPase
VLSTNSSNESNAKSKALTNLEANLDDIAAFLARTKADKLIEVVRTTSESVTEYASKAPNIDVHQIKSLVERLSEITDDYLAFRNPAFRMICVMLVWAVASCKITASSCIVASQRHSDAPSGNSKSPEKASSKANGTGISSSFAPDILGLPIGQRNSSRKKRYEVQPHRYRRLA